MSVHSDNDFAEFKRENEFAIMRSVRLAEAEATEAPEYNYMSARADAIAFGARNAILTLDMTPQAMIQLAKSFGGFVKSVLATRPMNYHARRRWYRIMQGGKRGRR